MDPEALRGIAGIEVTAPADQVALAVADSLLPAPLPPTLVEFLTLSDGARLGETEIFDVERITEVTNAGEHSWQLPGAVVIGRAGRGRALVMMGAQAGVCEVDEATWDSRTLRHTADAPVELFTRHRGLPLGEREQWWAWPSLGAAIAGARQRLALDTEALLRGGFGTRWGQPFATTLEGFQRADASQVPDLLVSEVYADTLLNYRPSPPGPGTSVRVQWGEACDAVVIDEVRDRLRQAPLSAAITDPDRVVGAGEDTVGDLVRQYAHLVLLARARDELRALATGVADAPASPVGRLAQVYLAGHVPVSLHAAI